MRVQLWSYNYAPEPTGIGPVSTLLASLLSELGHEVSVVAAHPHYPSPRWGSRIRPYRQRIDGIPVVRLPLWIGRSSAAERYRQEVTFTAALGAAAPLLPRPDAIIAASPSFPALLPTMLNARVRKIPWILWLHDLLPDGAMSTGLVEEGVVLKFARRLERAAYREADLIAVLSRSFVSNLEEKGVPPQKIELIYDPATRAPRSAPRRNWSGSPLRVLSMGNIGHSQGLAPLVGAFERYTDGVNAEVELVITGEGVAADEVRSEIRTDRVEMPGTVSDDRLEHELQSAHIALVTQKHHGAEFNIPSKLMNFMAYGLPVLAAVNPGSEVARLVTEADAGWVVDSSDPDALPRKLAEVAGRPDELEARAEHSRRFAEDQFTRQRFASLFDDALRRIADAQPSDQRRAETR